MTRYTKADNYFIKITFMVIIVTFLSFTSLFTYAEQIHIDSGSINKNVTSEKEKIEQRINTLSQEVNQLIAAQMFKQASNRIANLRKEASKLGSSSYTKEKIEQIDKQEKELYRNWADYLENKAEGAAQSKEWEKSIKYAQSSIDKLKAQNITATAEKNKAKKKSSSHQRRNWSKTILKKSHPLTT